jgi:hypothetical protein
MKTVKIYYKNKFNGERFWTIKDISSKFVDGVEFIQVFNEAEGKTARNKLMRADSLERIER